MNESLLGIGVFAAISVVVGVSAKDDIAQQFEASRELRARGQQTAILAAATDLHKLDLQQQIADKRELQGLETADSGLGNEVAISRYRSNCRSPRAADGQGIAIVEGMSLTDPLTGYPIQNGTPVCDSSGNTGVLEDGKVMRFARLTDTPKRVLPKETFDTYFRPVAAAKLEDTNHANR